MRDDFEDFVTKHKYNFDQVEEIPIDAMWHEIERDLAPRRSKMSWIWKVAAAVLALAISVPIGVEVLSVEQTTEHAMTPVAEVFPAWEPEENKYLQLISAKKREIGFDTVQVQNFPELQQQLKVMETDFTQSISDLERYGDKEAILKVLVRYHERQLNILEKLAREAEKEKHNAKPYEDRIY